jgi:hypothetical protein
MIKVNEFEPFLWRIGTENIGGGDHFITRGIPSVKRDMVQVLLLVTDRAGYQ